MPLEPHFDLEKGLNYIDKFLDLDVTLFDDGTNHTDIQINPTLGPIPNALVESIIQSKHPAKILEIGTSVGQTAINMANIARSYGGKVTTIEINAKIAEIAFSNIDHFELNDNIEIIIGDANKVINQLKGPFGLVIQDGKKDLYIKMLDRIISLMEPGGILLSDDILFPIMFDNPKAMTLDPYNQALKEDKRLKTVWLPIGDGVAISTKCY